MYKPIYVQYLHPLVSMSNWTYSLPTREQVAWMQKVWQTGSSHSLIPFQQSVQQPTHRKNPEIRAPLTKMQYFLPKPQTPVGNMQVSSITTCNMYTS
jgi:hypothetical protein